MKNSKIIEFHQISQDFLRLIGDKSRQAEKSMAAAQELGIMEMFWHNIEKLIREYELEKHETVIMAVNAQIKARLLDADMRDLLNEIYKVRQKIGPDELARILSRKVLPSKQELMEVVVIKNPNHQPTKTRE